MRGYRGFDHFQKPRCERRRGGPVSLPMAYKLQMHHEQYWFTRNQQRVYGEVLKNSIRIPAILFSPACDGFTPFSSKSERFQTSPSDRGTKPFAHMYAPQRIGADNFLM